jgi:hypothetical protein
VADSTSLRSRRHYAHRRGDHTLCRPGRCPEAGTVTPEATRGLLGAVEAEFAGDPARLEVARSLVAVAQRGGQPAAAALRELGATIEAKRRGELVPADVGAVIDAELHLLLDEVVELEVARRLTELAGRRWLGPGDREVPALIDELLGELRGVR